jgi:uncharacterized protein YgbK (DUF1537 family)
MIVVIADDFSGASEIAGIGWRYGLNCEIQTETGLAERGCDLIVVDSDTRSLPVHDAKIKIKQIIHQITGWPYHLLYKKVDSVLRGHVLAELKVMIDQLNLHKVLLIPANPTTGRIIKEKKYYINNLPLHQTEFAQDPEYPAKNSKIDKLLGEETDWPVNVLDRPGWLTDNGIFLGSVQTVDQLNEWAVHLNHDTLAAGAADFFRALLMLKMRKIKTRQQSKPLDQQSQQLIVIGSAAGQKESKALQAKDRQRFVCPLPVPKGNKLVLSDSYLKEWINQITGAFQIYQRVIAMPGIEGMNRINVIKQLPQFMARMVAGVIEKIKIDYLIISGGSTASQIIRFLSWTNLIPVNEIGPGIVMMSVMGAPEYHVIVKPGSYPWPEQLLI